MEGYYQVISHFRIDRSNNQETGRAGRDGKNSVCVLFYRWSDKHSVGFLYLTRVSLIL